MDGAKQLRIVLNTGERLYAMTWALQDAVREVPNTSLRIVDNGLDTGEIVGVQTADEPRASA